MVDKFDLIVIGAGSGSKLARPVARLGYKVAYVEKAKLGGTCLNYGCIPSKMLIHPADVISEIEEAHKFGIRTGISNFDREALVRRVNNEIDNDSNDLIPAVKSTPNLTLFMETCKFSGHKTVCFDNGHEITAEKIIIATGCRPRIPDIDGLAGTPFMTSKEALRLTSPPETMIVIGGGYIACELGYYFQKTGTAVDFLVRSKLLSQLDESIQEVFSKEFSKKHSVTMSAVTTHVEYTPNEGFTVKYTVGGKSYEKRAEQLLIASGVVPNTDLLNLQSTGIEVDSNLFVKVDSNLQTNVEGIYSFGDVIGRNLFKHTANFEGEWLFDRLFMNSTKPLIYPAIPWAVFTNPQVAGAGIGEVEAVSKYGKVVIGACDYSDVAMGQAMLDDHGSVKLIFAPNRKLVGATIVGKEASSLIHILMVFMQFGGTVDDVKNFMYIHPALPEVIRGAARDAFSKF